MTAKSTRTRTLVAIASAAVVAPLMSAQGMVTDSGNFYNEVSRLKDLAFGANSNLYIAPTSAQVDSFKTLAQTLLAGNISTADSEATALNYDLVQYTDTSTSRSYYELREKLNGSGQQTLGWGTFVYSPAATVNAIVEVPHVLFDQNSENVGAKVFQLANAKFFVMAGAQRNANGEGTADVAHLSSSIFEGVHEAWNGVSGQTTAWQVHGFDETSSELSAFPTDTAAVMADGAGNVTSKMLNLDKQFQAHGLTSYAYNTLSSTDATNKLVNTSSSGTVADGSTFSPLGATTNVQSAYSRSLGGTFVHVEMSEAVRFSSSNITLAATSIALAMQDSVVSLKLWDGGPAGTSAAWGTASSWSSDAFPASTDAVLFDNSLVATLPASMNVFHTAGFTVQYMTWDSNNSSEIHASNTNSTNTVLAFNGDGVGNTTPLLSLGALATTATLQFKNTNTGTGGTGKIVLQLNTSGAFNVTNPGATLQIDTAITDGSTGGIFTLEKTGAGLMILNGTNTIAGVIASEGVVATANTSSLGPTTSFKAGQLTLNGGTFRWTDVGFSSTSNRGLTVTSNGGTFEMTNSAASITFAGAVTGPGMLTKGGTGELILTNAGNVSSFTGGVDVTGGVLTFSQANALPASPNPAATQFTVDGGTLRFNFASSGFSANRKFAIGANGGTIDIESANVTIPGSVSGSGTLTKIGTGVLALTGSNSFGGGVVVNNGILSISGATGLGATPTSPTTNLTLNNSTTFRWTGSDVGLSSNRGVSLGAGTPVIDIPVPAALTISGVIDGPSASLTKTGTGTLVLAGSNTYAGGTVVNGGVVSISQGTNLGASPVTPMANNLTLNNGTLQVTGGFTLAGNRGVVLGASGGTMDVEADNPFSVAGTVSGSGSIVKSGTGTLVLNNGNTYTGLTSVLNGTLSTSAASSIGVADALNNLPALIVANNATLEVTSSYVTNRGLVIGSGGATISVDPSVVYTRTFTNTGTDTLTKTGAGTMVVANLRIGPVNVAQGMITVASNGTDAGTSLITGLTIGDDGSGNYTGTFNLVDNKLAIDYSGTSPIDTVRQYLKSGRATGDWSGTGLASSAAGADGQQRLGIAYAEASVLGMTQWGGQTVDGTTVLTKLTYYGDANMDGTVDSDDYALLDRGNAKHLTGWVNGDFNYDGVVDMSDYMLADRGFGLQNGVLDPAFLAERDARFGDAYVSQLVASVPEPTALGLLIAAVPMIARRRRA